MSNANFFNELPEAIYYVATVPDTLAGVTRENQDLPCEACGDRVRYHFDGWNGNKLIGYCEDRLEAKARS